MAKTKDDDQNFLVVVISELNLFDSSERTWWLNSWATTNICNTERVFSALDMTKSGDRVFMGNLSSSEVKGKGTVI